MAMTTRRKRKPSQPDYPDEGIRGDAGSAGTPRIVAVADSESLVREAETLRRSGQFHLAEARFKAAVAGDRKRLAPEVLCWGMWGQATSLRNRSRYVESAELYIRTMTVAQSSGAVLCERWCLAGLAEIDRMRGFLPQALRSHEELAALFRRENDARGLGWALSGMAQIKLNLGSTADANALFREAEEVAHRVGDRIGAAYALRGQAEAALRRGDMATASRLSTAARESFEAIPYAVGTAYAIRTMSHVALAERRRDRALELAQEAMMIFRRLRKPRGIAYMEQTLSAIGADGLPSGAAHTRDGRSGLWLAALPSLLIGESGASPTNRSSSAKGDRG